MAASTRARAGLTGGGGAGCAQVAIRKVHTAMRVKGKGTARKGEADRHIPNLMPKHLYSGKRGNGKTDRR